MTAPASASTIWEHYVQYFDFSQLGWLFENFMKSAVSEFLQGDDIVMQLIKGWLDHHWHDALSKYEVDAELFQQAMASLGASSPLNFYSFTDVLRAYVSLHLTREPHAGFPPESVMNLQKVYNDHNIRGEEGLKGKALFGVLEDLGIVFHSKEERQWYVQVVKRLDTNKDGSINFQELCQIMRVVVDNNDVKKRMREFNLVKQSKLPFDEAEDWNALFLACDEEGRGELELAQMRTLLENIGLKWDHEMSETVKGWMEEADENASDTIDFGEFCIFVSKLWTTDYHNIRAACRQFLKKDTAVSLKSVHGTYLSTDTSGDVFARSREIGQAETFVMSIHTNANASFRGFHGKSVDVHEEKVTCLEERSGTQFKMTPQDDDRVIFVAATSFGGVLYATPDGMVRCSDGNPNDIPNAIWELVRQEDLQKKCWSRSVAKRRPSKLVAPTKKPSIEESPLSPGLKQSIAEMDEALEANKS